MSSPTKKRGPHEKGAWKNREIHPDSLAGRVRAARVKTGLTTRDFAKHTSVSHGTITDIENAKTDPKVPIIRDVLNGLLKVLGKHNYAKFFPLDLDLDALKADAHKAGIKITEQIVEHVVVGR
jgi:transcriptional regulator with XRE-family HTH domain